MPEPELLASDHTVSTARETGKVYGAVSNPIRYMAQPRSLSPFLLGMAFALSTSAAERMPLLMPDDFQELYLGSLKQLGFDPLVHDIRFVEDNWESPTLGAWGLGWEVWLNGMEVTQFTYFQQVGGLECNPVSGEISYGIERLAMYIQGVDSIYDLIWARGPQGTVTYGDIYHQNEVEQSTYNFELADSKELFHWFDVCERQGQMLVDNKLPLPAYEQVMKASHAFNLLDARHAISVTERQRFILRVRTLSRGVAQAYFESRELLGFPLLKHADG